jgi:hypothetical protein
MQQQKAAGDSGQKNDTLRYSDHALRMVDSVIFKNFKGL